MGPRFYGHEVIMSRLQNEYKVYTNINDQSDELSVYVYANKSLSL